MQRLTANISVKLLKHFHKRAQNLRLWKTYKLLSVFGIGLTSPGTKGVECVGRGWVSGRSGWVVQTTWLWNLLACRSKTVAKRVAAAAGLPGRSSAVT